jgi:hypothetical protein
MVGEPPFPPPHKADTLGDLFQTFYDDQTRAVTVAEKQLIKDTAISVLAIVFGTATGVSLIPFESNFGAYTAGGILRDMMNPIVHRVIAGPMDAWLRKAFREGGISPRIAVSMLESGAASPDLLENILIDDNVKDVYLPVIRQYAVLKQTELVQKNADKAAKAKVDLFAAEHSSLVTRAEAAVSKLESSLNQADVNKITFPLTRLLRITEGQANQIDKLIDNALFLDGKPADKALAELQRILANPLPKYPGTPQPPGPVTVHLPPIGHHPGGDFVI